MDYINQSIAVHSQGRMHNVAADSLPENMRYGLKGSVENLFIPTAQPLTSELNHFADCIWGKTTPRITGEQALAALRIIWKVQQCLNNNSLSQAAE